MVNVKRTYVFFWETPLIQGKQKKGNGGLVDCELEGMDLLNRLRECAKEQCPNAYLTNFTEIPNGNKNTNRYNKIIYAI